MFCWRPVWRGASHMLDRARGCYRAAGLRGTSSTVHPRGGVSSSRVRSCQRAVVVVLFGAALSGQAPLAHVAAPYILQRGGTAVALRDSAFICHATRGPQGLALPDLLARRVGNSLRARELGLIHRFRESGVAAELGDVQARLFPGVEVAARPGWLLVND